MRQRIDVTELYGDALAAMPTAIDGLAPGPVSPMCPLTLDNLLAGRSPSGASSPKTGAS